MSSLITGRKGLVGVDSEEAVKNRLAQLKDQWQLIAPGFYEWFCEYKVGELTESMLAPVRQSAGLGNPPEPFYTNTIESINRVIKQKTGYKTSEWPTFCKIAHELVNEQQDEVEKAVIGIGEYLFCEDFRHLQLSLTKWSLMTKVQKEKYLQKISKLSLRDAKIPFKAQSVRGTEQSSTYKDLICEERSLMLKLVVFHLTYYTTCLLKQKNWS